MKGPIPPNVADIGTIDTLELPGNFLTGEIPT